MSNHSNRSHVKVIQSNSYTLLESEVNKFLDNQNNLYLIDIKYNIKGDAHLAMVIYRQ